MGASTHPRPFTRNVCVCVCVLRSCRYGAYIALMDLDQLLFDAAFTIPSITWFPLHFNAVSPSDW